jgi:hypothetical protein
VIKPDNGKNATDYEKRKNRQRFRRRAAIEPTISHLKHQYRMGRNYLKGIIGDQINAMMAAAAWNFKKWMREIAHSFLCLIFYILRPLQNSPAFFDFVWQEKLLNQPRQNCWFSDLFLGVTSLIILYLAHFS